MNITTFLNSSLHFNAYRRYPFLLFELKSITRQFFTRSRVFLRVLVNEIKGTKTVPVHNSGVTSQVIQINRRPLLRNLGDTSCNHHWNSLLGKIIGKRTNNAIAASIRRNIAKNLANGVSLGLVGVGFINKDNVPVLFNEEDELDAVIQDIRLRFSAVNWNIGSQFNQKGPIMFNLEDIKFGNCIAKGCNAAVYDASIEPKFPNPIAIKVMFNYDAESNADIILKSMAKECLTFQGNFGSEIFSFSKERSPLKYHPNIIEILGTTVDMLPSLPEAEKLFPSALPPRLCEHGFGRNMTLFLAMPKYDCTLRNYLDKYYPTREISLILLSQLFDGISYLVKNGIAHRDLKADNILIDLREGHNYPWLVITDFGHCSTSLILPFYSDEISRGGNQALMAPEIILAQPGSFSYLNYSAADIWSAGAIAYEIMGQHNPFYKYPDQLNHLDNRTYDESDLPRIERSKTINLLLKKILNRKPSSRPTPAQARNVCYLLLLLNQRKLVHLRCLNKSNLKPSIKAGKIIPLIKNICSSTLFQRTTLINGRQLNSVEKAMRTMFLSQLNSEDLLAAIAFIQID
ncbi:serine/threonine-protein kinase PINK1, mitochondrial [Tetranychus urticae]|uniref:non-specific serine/threonine protein kinase n=1 Tax=Tetranychus urticae TaxID=32264 RepID=T1JVJ7_TETUR|nr:serine/threonine-protein kinase PINK1, mitochondrial [Tetranychus urticae]